MKEMLQRTAPHLLVVGVFVLLTVSYFFPLFQGYRLIQGDITNFYGMAQEILSFRKLFGEEPLWTNSMFGGMPAYQISVRYPNDILGMLDRVISLGLPSPAKYLYLYLLGFYFLLSSLRLKPLAAVAGSIAFAFSTYFIIILVAGHNSKAHAIAYMAPTLAGILMAYRGRPLLGSAITALFLALQIGANHVQITYYFGILVATYLIAKLVMAVRSQQLTAFIRSSALLALAAALALAANINNLWNTYAYGQYTIRGETELTIEPDGSSNQAVTTGGLNRDYVTQWSYGIGESLTLLIPNAYGGASGALIDEHTAKEDPQMYAAMAQGYQATQLYPNSYWGDQPFTSGPVYVGASVFLLFLLGAVFVRGPLKWSLLGTSLLCLALAWGKNFMGLTNFFLDYIPGYNKFRAVTIILSILELCVPLLGFLFVRKLLQEPDFLLRERKRFLYVAGGLTAVLAILSLAPDLFFDFISAQEHAVLTSAMAGEQAPAVLAYMDALKAARSAAFSADGFRSLLIVVITAGLVWFWAKDKLKITAALPLLALVILFDLWQVDKRYLNNEKVRGAYAMWEPAEQSRVPFEPKPADEFILNAEMQANPHVADAVKKAVATYREQWEGRRMMSEGAKNAARFAGLRFSTDYRVLPLGGTFQDARTAYFHRSLGGYHGAKLKRIQEIHDFHLAPEIARLQAGLQNDPTLEKINALLRGSTVINMFNVKYIIYNPDAAPLLNPHALGPAWFVEELITTANADEEITRLDEIDPRFEATVDQRFADQISSFNYRQSADAAIVVKEHLPNRITYLYESDVPQAVIFSEIYYDDGWKAYVDGQESPYFRANYLLRGMLLPEGTHTIEWRFEPARYHTANLISTWTSVLILLLLAASMYRQYQRSTGVQQ